VFEAVCVGGASQTQAFGCTAFACSCGCEWDCPTRCRCRYGFHAGIDFAARSNTVLTAAGYGQVIQIGRGGGGCGGLGPFAVGIQSGGVVIWYGHCAINLVSKGQYVVPGQPVARMGFLGCVYPHGPGGTHCHFEVAPVGAAGCSAVDPGPYLTRWPGAAPAPPPGNGSGPPAPGPTPDLGPWAMLAAAGLLLYAGSK
jgi:hypothetical protein